MNNGPYNGEVNNFATGLNTLLFHPCTVDEQIFSGLELSATNI